jgi:raffinose/stachyose/melibiose transport system permease protein
LTAVLSTQAAAEATNARQRQRLSRMPSTQRLRHALSGTLLVAFTLFMLLPVAMVVNISLRPSTDVGTGALDPPSSLAWGNYVDVFQRLNFLTSAGNTLLITVASAGLVILVGSLCAWAITRHTRRWTVWAYRLFVSGLTIPVFVLLTPLFLLMRDLHLLDNYLSVILANAAINLPIAVFFYCSFLRSVPAELEDAAAVDGCGLFGTYWRIVMPLLSPATATVAIFISLATWNDLILPLVFLSSPEKSTVVLSAYSLIGSRGRFQTAQLFPAVVLATLPLFFLFLVLQRRIVAGITAGMSKG